jgi:hypothetical protein
MPDPVQGLSEENRALIEREMGEAWLSELEARGNASELLDRLLNAARSEGSRSTEKRG